MTSIFYIVKASDSINAKVTVLKENVLTCRSLLPKETHRENMFSNNSQVLTKIMNMTIG